VNSLSAVQLKKGYNSRKKTEIVYSEQDKNNISVPDEGIYYDELNKEQKDLLVGLVAEYFNNFNSGEVPFENHIHCFWRTNNDFGKVVIHEK